MADDESRFQFVNQVGYEAFEHITKRMEELGPLEFIELFSSVVGAATVCLANALRPGVEAAAKREVAADNLTASALKQVRSFLDTVVRE